MPDFEFMNNVMARMEADRQVKATQAAAIQETKAWKTNRRIGTALLIVAVLLAFWAETL